MGALDHADLARPVLTTGPFHRHEHQLTTFRVHELMTAER